MAIINFEGNADVVTNLAAAPTPSARGLAVGSVFIVDGEQYLVVHSKRNADDQRELKVVAIAP